MNADGDMLSSFAYAMELFGVGVFAIAGALVASRKQMDIFGFALLGTVTGIGGGTFRDLVLGRTPVFWIKDPTYLAVCVVVTSIVFFTAHILHSRYRALLWFDAVGLSALSVIGAKVGLLSGASPFVAIVMGVVTATCGGIARDLLGGESPLVVSKPIYVPAALLGAAVCVFLYGIGVAPWAASTIGFMACFTLRALAVRFGWSLPRYKPRAATPSELEKG